MAPSSRKRVSLVVPCYNEDEAFPHLRSALCDLIRDLNFRYEVEALLVDDGSRDRTWSQIRDFAREFPGVRGLSLSRNFGHQAALTCGYRHATGDAVISLDADLQDPPSVIVEMLETWERGADVVYAVRRNRAGESRFKKWTAAGFYRVARYLGASSLRADAGDFRLLDRRSLDAVLAMPERHRFLRGMVGWVGFSTADVYYDRQARIAGHTKYPLRKMLGLATDAIVSCSSVPLRFPYYFSVSAAGLCVLYFLYLLISQASGHTQFPPGWMALMIAVVSFGCLILCSLGVLGEYVGRIYEQVKSRPLYLVRETIGMPPEAAVRGNGRSMAA
ncbi:MAG TPA: glycosyltransferase family 2 protein [Fimbriiglobus sp.]|jgi:dolichol-phosphate mannosyltransferase